MKIAFNEVEQPSSLSWPHNCPGEAAQSLPFFGKEESVYVPTHESRPFQAVSFQNLDELLKVA